MQLVLFASLLIIGNAIANTETGNTLNEIPGLDNLALPGISEENGIKFFKEKCKNQTKDDKVFDKILESKETFQNCFKGQLNVSELQQEIEDAKPTGDLDVVFGKYCRKIPTLKQCTKDFYKLLEPCLTQDEKNSVETAFNVTQTIIDFLCYKDGDRIALFIAEGGVECIKSKQTEIQNCWKQTIGESLPTEVPKFDAQCTTLESLQTCIVNELEKCKEPTPANLSDALFKYVRKILNCPKKQ